MILLSHLVCLQNIDDSTAVVWDNDAKSYDKSEIKTSGEQCRL